MPVSSGPEPLGGHRGAPRGLASRGSRRGPGAGVPGPAAVQREVPRRPTARASGPAGTALVHPARARVGAARRLPGPGVEIHEHTPGFRGGRRGLVGAPHGLRLGGSPAKVALATNVFPSLLARHRCYTVPVYDYALMTEPLTGEQREAIGWARPARPLGHEQPLPLLPADHRRRRRDGGSCSAATTRSTIRPVAPAQPRQRPKPRSAASPPTSTPPSRSWRSLRSPTHGAAPSTPAAASSPSSRPPTAAGSPTAPASPAWAWGPRASAPT